MHYSALVEYFREKNIQLGRLKGIGFDGVATFSGDKTGVQRRLKELSPHALFVHCCCHVLQLASVQAANATLGIKYVYTTLMTLWKFFHYFPNLQSHYGDSESTRSSIAQDGETTRHTLACTIGLYVTSQESEALGLSKDLSSHSTIAAMYLLDDILPQVTKLSRAFTDQAPGPLPYF